MRDRVFRTSLDTEATEDAAAIVDVVNLGIALIDADAFFGRSGIVCSFDVDALGRASRRAKKTRVTLFTTKLVNVQQVLAAITRLYGYRLVRIFNRLLALRDIRERNPHPLNDGFGGFDYVTND